MKDKNKEYYMNMSNEIHVPPEVLGKVMDMKKKDIRRKNMMKYAASIAAAFVVCFLASNGICYAATGNTWIGEFSMYINGEWIEQEITFYEEDDTIYGELEVETDDESTTSITIIEEDASEYDAMDLTNEIIQEDGKTYLCIGDSKIDITEDFADGYCSGTFEMNGETLQYEVSGNAEDYELSVQNE